MAVIKEEWKVNDSAGFNYFIDLEHYPEKGVAHAYYRGDYIRESLQRNLYQPESDNDRVWEHYEEVLEEWKDEAKTNLEPICRTHLDNIYP